MARLAWFSPYPPVRSGIAACSADLVPRLRHSHEIDVFVDEPTARANPAVRSAHDFVWRHHLQPYDLTVFQIGNSSHHDYQWPYLFRYPGLVVLHDLQLHHARAAALLRTERRDDYRAEFRANHPDADVGLAELAVAGFDTHLYYRWPLTRLVAESSRLVAVHNERLAAELRIAAPRAAIETVALGHGAAPSDADRQSARDAIRQRYGWSSDVLVFGCVGGLSPEKRIPQVLAAFAATRAYAPGARLMLAGAPASHYDVRADLIRHGLENAAVLTGYLADDDELTAHIAACDVGLSLRWPTAREISGPWLRCLALGLPTVIVSLSHLADVPALDPRTWASPQGAAAPVTVAIDILDEDHSLRLAMRRLAGDADLRAQLGAAARDYWQRHHTVDTMAGGYERLIALATASAPPPIDVPAHLADRGERRLDEVMAAFGLSSPLR